MVKKKGKTLFNRTEILKLSKDKPWVSPFEKIVAVHDKALNIVQIYEYHARNACYGAAAWAVYHYNRTSSLVVNARRDGARDIFTLKLGKTKLELKPSLSSAGIEAVKVQEDAIRVTYAGLAGGGVGSTLCRAMGEGVYNAEIHEEGGGDKLGKATLVLPKMVKVQVGVDDTDKKGAGATWSLANEIAVEFAKSYGIHYLNHTLVQLFPGTPERTTNCVATVLTFAVKPDRVNYLKNELKKRFLAHTLSEQTGLAVWEGVVVPKEIKEFSNNAKKRVVTIEDAKKIASAQHIDLVKVTGARGFIGAVAGIGYAEEQEQAVKLE
jgi:methanogenesis imperfect marker protein 11